MDEKITPRKARKVVSDWLKKHNLEYNLITRTVSFTDLARGECIFVIVKDWKPSTLAYELEDEARRNGFLIDFA